MSGFPWREAMAFGLGRLGLPSADFWALTPRELAAAAEGVFGLPGRPPDRDALSTLMARYPDKACDPDKACHPDKEGGADADPDR